MSRKELSENPLHFFSDTKGLQWVGANATDVFGSVNNTFLVTDQVSSAARVWFHPLVGSKVAAEAVSHMV